MKSSLPPVSKQVPLGNTKVLLIGIANSIHTARWIEQFKNQPIEITLIPSTARRRVHPQIHALLRSEQELVLKLPWLFYAISIPTGIVDLFFKGRAMGYILRIWLRRYNNYFDVVHAMELQHAGYIMETAITRSTGERVIISNWGSDIYWYQQFPRHKKRLKKLMEISSHYSCECHRDIGLAASLGFKGQSFEVQPNAGPISSNNIEKGRSAIVASERKRIMVKGYTGFVGRADIALAAIGMCAEELKNYEVCLYSSDSRSRRIARRLAKDQGITIKLLRKYELTHDEMLQYFRDSRLYIGISMSDGISTSLLEAIASGTFPIQTDTSCADEWITHGLNGFIVDFNKTEDIANFIKRALSDDDLVNSAARINFEVAEARLSPAALKDSHLQFYS